MDCIIVGGGVGGFQAAAACRRHWPEKSVLLLEAEAETGYYRTLLPQFMVGTLTEEKLFFWKPESSPDIGVRTGLRVAALYPDRRTLHLENGDSLGYERLILACGGRAIVPKICSGQECGGVFPVRSLAAARAVKTWLPENPRTVVLGGGLVGVKTAAHLAHAGFPVTLIERERTLLPLALSPDAAAPVAAHLAEMGIELVLGHTVEDVRSTGGRLKGVRAGGRWFACDTLLVAAGSVPDIAFLEGSGLLEDGKLAVAPTLQTRDERIYALGDAVTIRNGAVCTPWTWPQAVSQGKLAGHNCFAPHPSSLNRLSRVNAMNLFGLSLVVLGAPVPGAGKAVYRGSSGNVYRELYILEDRIVGGALVGDISGAGTLHAQMVSGHRCDVREPDPAAPRAKAFLPQTWVDVRQRKYALTL